jgi:hypothetical protein
MNYTKKWRMPTKLTMTTVIVRSHYPNNEERAAECLEL